MADTFGVDRRSWELAKQQLAPTAPPSNIALLAQEIKEELVLDNHLTIDEVMRRIQSR